jgi:hypothetical protein
MPAFSCWVCVQHAACWPGAPTAPQPLCSTSRRRASQRSYWIQMEQSTLCSWKPAQCALHAHLGCNTEPLPSPGACNHDGPLLLGCRSRFFMARIFHGEILLVTLRTRAGRKRGGGHRRLPSCWHRCPRHAWHGHSGAEQAQPLPSGHAKQDSRGQATDVLPARIGRALPGMATLVHTPCNVCLDS